MKKTYFQFLLCVSTIFPQTIFAQEIKIFKLSDFDLIGNVKSCLVQAHYGKEEYDFNTEGLLTKSVTRYNDTDYDISYYKYENKLLVEKRVENFRNNSLDKETSIAHLYEIDSSNNLKIVEKIISYNKEYLDLYEFRYDNQNRLVKILRSNNNGNDETNVVYSNEKGISNTTYTTNGEISKEISVLYEKLNDTVTEKVMTSKRYLGGLPNQKVKERYNYLGKLKSIEKYDFNSKSEALILSETTHYDFDEKGVLNQSNTKIDTSDELKDYIYQFDAQGNWVKEIISPDNTYTTRKITYYQTPEPAEEK